MKPGLPLLIPDWPAPPQVRAAMSTRQGGVSAGPYASLNLGGRAGDNPAQVAENRRRLRQALQLRQEPAWLEQVHGTTVVRLSGTSNSPEADASFTTEPGVCCAVMAADCLPVLFCDDAGTVVAAAHAGWRGLAAGVLEATVRALPAKPSTLMAWLGAAIGPESFEVGEEVRAAFVARDAQAAQYFKPAKTAPAKSNVIPAKAGIQNLKALDARLRGHDGEKTIQAGANGKYLADLNGLARLRLAAADVTRVYGGGLCTFRAAERFFSYRRDGQCGRMAALAWLEKQ